MSKRIECVAVGSPIMDLLAEVSEEFVASIPGEKGGMELIDSGAMAEMVAKVGHQPVLAPGGSAGNTVFALARLGVSCGFVGKLGDDQNASIYKKIFEDLGGDCSRFKVMNAMANACCLSLVTPDSERTMRTDLGAAATLTPDEITSDDFEGVAHVHIEGYLLFNRDLMYAVLDCAKSAGCTISLDLASFEVVGASEDILSALLKDYVDMVFANEDEAGAFCGETDPEKALVPLGMLCDTAAVKIGKEGAWIRKGTETVKVPGIPAEKVIDTTGAGDLWAAGFLYGTFRGLPLEECGRCASLLGAQAVQQIGAYIPDERWPNILLGITGEGTE